MTKYWKNKNNELIDIDEMDIKYLQNIANYVEKRAKEGVRVYINIGSDTDSYYQVIDSVMYYEDDARALFKNYDYVLERLSQTKGGESGK